MLTTQRPIILVACATIAFGGCASFSKRPDPDWTKDLDEADAILVHQKDKAPVKIADLNTVKRLRQIYTDSRWTPYRDTLPGYLGQRSIEVCKGDIPLRRFAYAGTLWESESYTQNRTAKLSEADREWIDSLFATPPGRIGYNRAQLPTLP